MAAIYKIGVEIALAGNILQGLQSISKHLLGINTQVNQVHGGFNRWALAVGGVASVMGGAALAGGMAKVVEAGGELVKQQAALRSMGGISEAQITGATTSAQIATQKVLGTTIAENLKGIREMMGVSHTLEDAENAYPAVMQAAKVLESLGGGNASDTLKTLAKAIELRGGGMNPVTGQLDSKRFVDEAMAAQAAIVASGGLVNASSLLQYMKTAGPMARMMSDPDQFYHTALTAIMDMGGFRAGTAMTAAGRQLLGGKMAKPTAEEMQNLGLLETGKWHASGTGVFVDKGALAGEDILKDPKRGMLDWANKILIPALAAKGITSSADIQQEMYRVFGTETTRRMMGLFVQNEAQVTKDNSLYDNARKAGSAYTNMASGDLGANVTNLKDAVANFLQAFGAPIVPMAIDVLQKLSAGINSMSQIALAHPEAMKLIGEGLLGLSVGLAAMGTVAIIAALAAFAPGGAAAVALAGLAAAGSALAAINWGAVSSGLHDLVNAIMAIPNAIGGVGSAIKGAISNAFGTGGATPGAASPFHGQPMHPSGLGSQSPNYPKQSSNDQPIHIKVAMVVDGKTLAESTSIHLARGTTFPTQAAYGDSYLGWNAPDNNFATG